MYKRKPKHPHLKVIEGQGKSISTKAENQGLSKPVCIFLFLLASFLIVQMLTGWLWGTVGQGSINTIIAAESKVDVSFSMPGTISFAEKVIFAPCSGFVYYKITEGQRVPVEKELAVITNYPLEKDAEGDNIEKAVETNEPVQRFKEWFLGDNKKEKYVPLAPFRDECKVSAPQPGLISFSFEGLEVFGPQSAFPYFSAEELQNIICSIEPLRSGEKVYRFQPLLKIIDNYYWYFSAVLHPSFGALIAGKPEVKMFFPFAPDIPVWGEQVELMEKDGGGALGITWCIGRELPDLYNQRRCEAEVVYRDMPGVLVPKSALVEVEGRQGVYFLEKGVVRFQEIDLLLEREDDVLIKNWEEQRRIVANPERVKEGQRYQW